MFSPAVPPVPPVKLTPPVAAVLTVNPKLSDVLTDAAVLVAVSVEPPVTPTVAELFDKPTLALAPDRFVEVEPVIVLVAPVTRLVEVPALPIVFDEFRPPPIVFVAVAPLPNVFVVPAPVAIVALPVLESVPVIPVLPVIATPALVKVALLVPPLI